MIFHVVFPMVSLTIGVPVRNEEEMLPCFFESLEKAIAYLPKSVFVEVVVCINNSTDASLVVAKSLQTKYQDETWRFVITSSPPGKITAEAQICRVRSLDGFIAFFDADILLKENTLIELMYALDKHKDIHLAYCKIEGDIRNAQPTCFYKFAQIHYNLPQCLSPRYYFHGRGFMVRDDQFILAYKKGMSSVKSSFLRLHDGPMVDDIHFSRVIVNQSGVGSIREVASARICYCPILTINDFYQSIRRTTIEIWRLNLLFPEHATLEGDVFRRRVKWSIVAQLPINQALHYACYHWIVLLFTLLVRLHLYLGDKSEFWIPLKSTKGGR
jgi:glycosyltransferase involved in cell wall biosynthesis